VRSAAQSEAAPGEDRDRKLQELEQRIQTLLEEVRSLRTGGATAKQQVRVIARPEKAGTAEKPAPRRVIVTTEAAPHVIRAPEAQPYRTWVNLHRAADPGVVNLTRATYKLTHAKAEALAGLLREHVKAPVIETKVEGDSLIVTTTPEAQHVIGQFVALIQGTAGAARIQLDGNLRANPIRLHFAPENVQPKKEQPLQRYELKVNPAGDVYRYEIVPESVQPKAKQPQKEQKDPPSN
jgi:hypothetical protein